MRTVLTGKFERSKMISAQPSKIILERCNLGIKEIKIARPKLGDPELKYFRPNRLRIGDHPRVMDPYTKKMVYIDNGVKEEGVFAKRNINKGELVTYYSGLFWNITEQSLFTRTKYCNQTSEEYWDIFRNLMSFDKILKIHIPKPYWNISNYRATLGHKVNHSFLKANVAFGQAFHPRFGNIRTIYAIKDIPRHEEILVNYGYQIGTNVPEWYADLYEKETGNKWYNKGKLQYGNKLCESKL